MPVQLPSFRRRKLHPALKYWLPSLVLVALLMAGLLLMMGPSAPRRLTLATGGAGGAYHAFGERYREAFAREGITLELRHTAGSIENIGLLAAGEVDLAFVQGGTGNPGAPDQGDFRTLASVFNEPIWVFYRGADRLRLLGQLAGRRLAIGPEGSGTEPVARLLLRMNGIGPDRAEMLHLSFTQARDALTTGTVDAAFFVASPTAQVVQDLSRAPDIHLLNFQRYRAYTRQSAFLKEVFIPQGLLDLGADVPGQGTYLLAATANVCAHADLHPAIAKVFVKVAREIHSGRGLLHDESEFPTRKYAQYPIHEAADEYFEYGPSFLNRYLPFWAVALIRRLTVLLVPLIALLFPLFKLAPLAYRWGMNRRIYRWYQDLNAIEQELHERPDREGLEVAGQQLRMLRDAVAEVRVPFMYRKDVYNLRMHINLVASEVAERRREDRNTRKGTGAAIEGSSEND